MTEKELRKLGRAELLELLLEQAREFEALEQRLNAAEAALQSQQLQLETCGSIAEASLKLNGVFEAAQSVINSASGIIVGNTSINLADHIADLEARLLEMNVWSLLGLWLQSFVVGFTMWALTICIFIIIYGRMIEIYLVTSIAPIPMATMMGKEWGGMGQNYLRSLLALAFQGFLIIICIAIYAVLVQNMLIDDNISTAIWLCMGYTVLLCFTLFKTSSLAKSIFNSH